MTDFKLTRIRIRAGQYEGILSTTSRRKTKPAIDLVLLGTSLAQATVTVDATDSKKWALQVKIPAIAISDGVQTFSLRDTASNTILGNFVVIAGEALQEDFRAEIALLRAELDMLKQAFRQHCNETPN